MSQSPPPLDYATPPRQSTPSAMILSAISFLLWVVTITLFIYFWLTKDFIPIHRDVLRPHTLTYFDAIFGDFLNLWTPIFFALPILGITLAFIYLRRRRTPIAWLALTLNILTLTALIILSLTPRDYPRIRIGLPAKAPTR